MVKSWRAGGGLASGRKMWECSGYSECDCRIWRPASPDIHRIFHQCYNEDFPDNSAKLEQFACVGFVVICVAICMVDLWKIYAWKSVDFFCSIFKLELFDLVMGKTDTLHFYDPGISGRAPPSRNQLRFIFVDPKILKQIQETTTHCSKHIILINLRLL